MADILRATRIVPGFHAALDLHLVEISPALRARQQETLARQGTREGGAGEAGPTWHERLDEVPDGPLLLVANEFFDALPIRQFEKRPEGWCERLVTLAPDGGALAFALAPPGPMAAALLPPELHDAPAGAIAEVSAPAIVIAGEIGRRLAGHGGMALITDYGHARPRSGATLQAVRRHTSHGVLEDPGAADLTAHVDFSALARAAAEAGARVHGPVPQGRFLEALGIGARAQALLESATPDQAKEIVSARRRLTDAREMGELFKALALGHPDLGPPAGFP
jgi:NADH dehydrogenase [ubiquinone] 1 alpha subcomplex assembly factor 7